MNAIDTNVWIYCHDAREPEKQQIAQRLVETIEPIVLPWQVGCEFIAASRKLEPFGFTREQAWQSLADMQAMAQSILLPVPELWPKCQQMHLKHGIHFWDAMILATCLHYRVATFYSEDMAESDSFFGLKIINPFRNEE
jgi:predicted nucleic acid-binding protein